MNQKQMNVCVTSGYCIRVQRNVTLLATILMGKTRTHYAEHFKVLFRSMNMSRTFSDWTSDDLSVAFPGNTSDFSDAERQGFELALIEHCNLDAESGELDLSQFYRCCSVHFKRNLEKVSRSRAVLSDEGAKEFKQRVLSLLDTDSAEELLNLVRDIQSQPKFQSTTRWLNWYLRRGRLIFPALANRSRIQMDPDTNAQESLGKDLQRAARPTKDFNILGMLNHIHQFMIVCEAQYIMALYGAPTNDSTATGTRPSRISLIPGDGQPPLKVLKRERVLKSRRPVKIHRPSIADLVKTKQQPKSPMYEYSQPEDTTNMANSQQPADTANSLSPATRGDMDKNDRFAGIKWGFAFRDRTGVNTCPVDTGLMTTFLPRTQRNLDVGEPGDLLNQIMEMIERKGYAEALYTWCDRVLTWDNTIQPID
jgi:hypothetical protein